MHPRKPFHVGLFFRNRNSVNHVVEKVVSSTEMYRHDNSNSKLGKYLPERRFGQNIHKTPNASEKTFLRWFVIPQQQKRRQPCMHPIPCCRSTRSLLCLYEHLRPSGQGGGPYRVPPCPPRLVNSKSNHFRWCSCREWEHSLQ